MSNTNVRKAFLNMVEGNASEKDIEILKNVEVEVEIDFSEAIVELVDVEKDVEFSTIQKIKFLHQELKELIDYHYSTSDMGYIGLLRSVENFYNKMTVVLKEE